MPGFRLEWVLKWSHYFIPRIHLGHDRFKNNLKRDIRNNSPAKSSKQPRSSQRNRIRTSPPNFAKRNLDQEDQTKEN